MKIRTLAAAALVAGVALPWVAVAGQAAGPAPKCLQDFPNIVTGFEKTYDDGQILKPSADTTLDLRGTTINGMGGTDDDTLAILRVQGFNNVCVLGGRFIGKQDPQVVPWIVGHAAY